MGGEAHGSNSQAVRVIAEPRIYFVGAQVLQADAMERFLADHGANWSTDTNVGAERLCEAAGRLCYMSFGQGRKTNQEYLGHILESGHGSVLEHAVWNFIITGVSRSFTHELIRHRAGFGYSQLSQRYVDESNADYVEPEVIAGDPELHAIWLEAIGAAQSAYRLLALKLTDKFVNVESRTARRKLARQAARSVLPNACETKIFVTANARALRHFIELRGSADADVEIRRVAVALLKTLRELAPNIFGDIDVASGADGDTARARYHKV